MTQVSKDISRIHNRSAISQAHPGRRGQAFAGRVAGMRGLEARNLAESAVGLKCGEAKVCRRRFWQRERKRTEGNRLSAPLGPQTDRRRNVAHQSKKSREGAGASGRASMGRECHAALGKPGGTIWAVSTWSALLSGSSCSFGRSFQTKWKCLTWGFLFGSLYSLGETRTGHVYTPPAALRLIKPP